jgi:hypothetical protein
MWMTSMSAWMWMVSFAMDEQEQQHVDENVVIFLTVSYLCSITYIFLTIFLIYGLM